MQNTAFKFGPIALTNTYTTNLLNPATTTGGTNMGTPNCYILLKHLRFVNKTAGAITFRLFLGATGANAAGTEVVGYDYSVAANSVYDWYAGAPGLKIKVADFLVGGASANTSLTLQGEGEYGLEL